jgi:hypothetical protein
MSPLRRLFSLFLSGNYQAAHPLPFAQHSGVRSRIMTEIMTADCGNFSGGVRAEDASRTELPVPT